MHLFKNTTFTDLSSSLLVERPCYMLYGEDIRGRFRGLWVLSMFRTIGFHFADCGSRSACLPGIKIN